MKIHLGYSTNNLNEIITQARSLETLFDQFAIGTLPLYAEGIAIIRQIKSEFPKKPILIKNRMVDYAQEHTKFFSSLGVNTVSVLPGISRTMLHAATTAAHDNGMKVALELFDTSFMNQSILEAKQLGVDLILFHYYHDNHGQSLSEQWDFIKDNINLPVILETSLSAEIIESLPVLRPEGIIITEKFLHTKTAADDLKYIRQLCNLEI